MKLQTKFKVAVAPVALSVALLAQPAFAQDEQPEEEVSSEAASAPIIVTGSRIARDEFTSTSPVTVVDPAIAVRQGLMDTGQMLQGSIVAAGSSQVTTAISSNFVTNGGAGSQTISLRGLGAERTLVLLNSRRAGPAGTRGAVSSFDLNVLPQSIVQRVDILKDGASSIYGSDAVAGVVNLITKTDTRGIELDVFASAPFEDGGETFSASATWGTTFDGGHFLISGNYYKQNELARGDRQYLRCPENYVFTDSTYSTRADLIDPRTGNFSCQGESSFPWGHVWTYDGSTFGSPFGSNLQDSNGTFDVSLLQYSYPGDNLGQHIPGIPARQSAGQILTPPGWFKVNYDPASIAVTNNYHPFMDTDTVIPQNERFTVYADTAYEFVPGVEVYAEVLFNKRKTYQNASRQFWGFGYGEFFDYAYFVGDELVEGGFPGDPFATGWAGYAVFSPTAYTDQSDNSQEVDYYRAVGGFRGDITDGWAFDLYGQYSKSVGKYRSQQILQDSIDYIYYRSSSCAGLTTPVGGKACVDANIFDQDFLAGRLTDAEKAFFFDWEEGRTDYTQWYVEGVVTGELFELPGGTVGVALGATYREDEINDTPGQIVLAGNAWGTTTSGITAGKTQTKEAFGEVSLPLIRDLPGIQSLYITAAARVTDVKAIRASDGFSDQSGGNWTYKFGLDWEITDWLRLRGTYGTSYRAPALFEQFLADQSSSLPQRSIDPCIQWGVNLANGAISQQLADGCARDGVAPGHTGAGISATIYQGGGIGVLEPETSRAYTASVVLTPYFDWAPDTRFSIAVDYFNIEVNGEIAQLGAGNIISGCYLSEFGDDDPLCGLFARNDDLAPGDPDRNSGDPSNVAVVRDSYINVNSQKNTGIDVTTRIVHDFGGDTSLTLQGQMTWQMSDEVALFSGFADDRNGLAGEPKFIGDFRAQLDKGDWSLFYGLTVIGGTSNMDRYGNNNIGGYQSGDPICRNTNAFPNGACYKLFTDAVFYHNVSVTRDIGENFRITAGIANLFDTNPPRTSNVGGDGITQLGQGLLYSQYDLLGRRAFVNFNVKY